MKQIEEELENITNELKSVQSQKEKYKTEVTDRESNLEEMKVSNKNVTGLSLKDFKMHLKEVCLNCIIFHILITF